MISNLLISFSELRKLGLLYLAIKYNSHTAMYLIFTWLIWQLGSAILFGALSDIKGRKPILYFTIFLSILVSLLARSKQFFSAALLVDGIFAGPFN